MPSCRHSQRNIRFKRLQAEPPLCLLGVGLDMCLEYSPPFACANNSRNLEKPSHTLESLSEKAIAKVLHCRYTNCNPRHIYTKSRPKNVRCIFIAGSMSLNLPLITNSNGRFFIISWNILRHPVNICFRFPQAIVEARNAAISMSCCFSYARGNCTGSFSMKAGVLNCSARASIFCFNSFIVATFKPPTRHMVKPGAIQLLKPQ